MDQIKRRNPLKINVLFYKEKSNQLALINLKNQEEFAFREPIRFYRKKDNVYFYDQKEEKYYKLTI